MVPERGRPGETVHTEITNVGGQPARDVTFHHVSSTERTLYLLPADEQTWDGPVDPGCWQLTEYVPVPEYYGVIVLEPGETIQADSYVYGHPDLPEGTCLPDGEHRLHTQGIAGSDETIVHRGTDGMAFKWGLTLRVRE